MITGVTYEPYYSHRLKRITAVTITVHLSNLDYMYRCVQYIDADLLRKQDQRYLDTIASEIREVIRLAKMRSEEVQ